MISKDKTVYHIALTEAKEQLRLDLDFVNDDGFLLGVIKDAVVIAEGEIQKDIAKTTNVLTRNEWAGSVIRVNEGNLISITSIEAVGPGTLSNYTTFANRDYFVVELDDYIDTTLLTVTFETGYAANNLNRAIRRAILLKVVDLYDIDRGSSKFVSIKESGQFERILAPFKASHVKHERES